MTVWFYHVTSAFKSKSILCNCLNLKELLAGNRWDISTLTDCNKTEPTTISFVNKAKLVKWLRVCLSSKWLLIRFPMQSLNLNMIKTDKLIFYICTDPLKFLIRFFRFHLDICICSILQYVYINFISVYLSTLLSNST